MTVIRREVTVEERIIGQVTTDAGGIEPMDLTGFFHDLGAARPLFKPGGMAFTGFSPSQLRDIAAFMEGGGGEALA